MYSLSFHDIPQIFKEMKNSINNPTIQKLYSEFSFSYFSCSSIINNGTLLDNDMIYSFLLNNLNKYKFISCKYTKSNTLNILKINVVICAEKQCFIIEQIENELIESILKKSNSIIINISDKDDFINFQTNEKIINEVKTEIHNFMSLFKDEIKNNFFINYTISPIICYLIRRFYYPSYFFKDKSFFKFNKSVDFEDEILDEITNISNLKQTNEIMQQIELIKCKIKYKKRSTCLFKPNYFNKELFISSKILHII